jgi:UDP-GlcNAc:undecaprenyl-phosphate/decaprenyl-phosphate GlcNAc-1-phosphate transferase
MMLIALAVALLVGSFTLSAGLTALARKVTPRFGLVARPKADRYHRTIIPLGGGIAIYGTLAAAILAAVVFIRFVAIPGHVASLAEKARVDPANFLNHARELLFIFVCATILFAMGLWDDKKALGPFFKLAVQWIVAFIAVIGADIHVKFFIHNQVVTSFLSAFWIVLIVNSFNFLDNMDGASAGIAAIVSAILLTAAAFSGQVFVGGLTLIFIGALLGFLTFNFPPASIFMGDAGSLVVGFFVALLTVRTTYYHQSLSGSWYPVLMPLVVMAVPLYDFVTVCSLRIRQGKSPFVGDTQHFSHRLRRSGLTDRQTALTLYLATLGCGLGATFLYEVSLVGAILICVQTFLILGLIAVFESTGKSEGK